MRRWLTRSFYASLFALASCGGGGGGCSSCSGVRPLPQGFPVDKRVENAANVRITKSGFAFLNKNLSTIVGGVTDGQGLSKGGKIEFPITTDPKGIKASVATLCEGGADAKANPKKCILEVDLKKANLKVAPAEPNKISITGTLPVLVEHIPGKASVLGADIKIKANVGEGDCQDKITPTDVEMDVQITIETDKDMTHGTRTGLSRVKTTVDPKLKEDQVHICTTCDNFLCAIGDSVLEGIKGALFGTIVGQLKAPITNAVDNALCVKPDPAASPTCPVGSSDKDGVCRFADGSCASFVLGTDGTMDLSSALASFSPSTKGGLDFQLAAGGLRGNKDNDGRPFGDLNVIKEGGTISMVGGILPNPEATCVKLVQRGLPTDIPTPTQLLDNTVMGWPAGVSGPDLGIGLSQRFLDHAMVGIYNSGLLCIQTGTDAVPQLDSATLGAIVPSIKTLALQKQKAPLGIILRPGQPPTVSIGTGKPIDDKEKDVANTDANLTIRLDELSADFYIWSSDRFIRAFTARMGLAVPINVDVGADGKLTPVLKKIFVTSVKVENNDLVKEPPANIESAVSGLIGGLAGQFLGGALPAFDLSSATAALGLGVKVPPNVAGGGSPGITKLSKDDDDFLGIFASLSVVAPVSRIISLPSYLDKKVVAEGVHFATFADGNAPVVRYQMDVVHRGTEPVEHAYKVDAGVWKPWVASTVVEATDDILRLQGTHTISMKSRIVGHPESESDVTTVPVVIDADPPAVEIVKKDDGTLSLDAWDSVSGEAVKVRVKLDGNDFSPWLSFDDARTIATGDAFQAVVEVRDEEGNVSSISQELRGKIDTIGKPPSEGGCGCTVPGDNQSTPPVGALLAAAGLAAALLRSRQRARRRTVEAVAGAAVLGVFGSFSGCNCGDGAQVDETKPIPAGGAGGKAGAGGGKAGAPQGGKAGAPAGGQAGAAGKPPKLECDPDQDCVKLEPGLIGSYTSTASDGTTVWVAGYSEADYEGEVGTYGDLVVGKWDAAKSKVAWEIVDGLDATEKVDPTSYDVTGWRGGKSEPGDDVGLWTSVQLLGGSPAVAYFDATNKSLKLARLEGTTWTTHTIQKKAGSDIGRYAKLLVIDGKPVVAYLAIEPGAGGKTSSFVRTARASSAKPTEKDWTFEDVATNKETPCRAAYCATGTKCQASSGLCVKTATTCAPSCKSPQTCFEEAGAAKCGDEISAAKVESYPEASGLYISAAIDGGDIGLVYYDRVRGNLHRVKRVADEWSDVVIAGSPPQETDAGIGASLAIDGAAWHVSYVDGLTESLVYMKLADGTTPGTVEIVDSGLSDEGPHLVGDDSFITVSGTTVRVSYQDATTGLLRVATRNGTSWATKPVSQDGKFGGFFSSQVTVGGKPFIANWWRIGKPKIYGDVSLVPVPLSPRGSRRRGGRKVD